MHETHRDVLFLLQTCVIVLHAGLMYSTSLKHMFMCIMRFMRHLNASRNTKMCISIFFVCIFFSLTLPSLYCTPTIPQLLFPPVSVVEGIKSVLSLCVCVCICVFVCQHSHGWTVYVTDLKFGRNIAFDNISSKFEGQGHRSKVKVAILKNVIFRLFLMVWPMYIAQSHFVMAPDVMWRHGMTSRCHVTSWRDVLTSFDYFWARILTIRARCGRASQCSGGFIRYTLVPLWVRRSALRHPLCNYLWSNIAAMQRGTCIPFSSQQLYFYFSL